MEIFLLIIIVLIILMSAGIVYMRFLKTPKKPEIKDPFEKLETLISEYNTQYKPLEAQMENIKNTMINGKYTKSGCVKTFPDDNEFYNSNPEGIKFIKLEEKLDKILNEIKKILYDAEQELSPENFEKYAKASLQIKKLQDDQTKFKNMISTLNCRKQCTGINPQGTRWVDDMCVCDDLTKIPLLTSDKKFRCGTDADYTQIYDLLQENLNNATLLLQEIQKLTEDMTGDMNTNKCILQRGRRLDTILIKKEGLEERNNDIFDIIGRKKDAVNYDAYLYLYKNIMSQINNTISFLMRIQEDTTQRFPDYTDCEIQCTKQSSAVWSNEENKCYCDLQTKTVPELVDNYMMCPPERGINERLEDFKKLGEGTLGVMNEYYGNLLRSPDIKEVNGRKCIPKLDETQEFQKKIAEFKERMTDLESIYENIKNAVQQLKNRNPSYFTELEKKIDAYNVDFTDGPAQLLGYIGVMVC